MSEQVGGFRPFALRGAGPLERLTDATQRIFEGAFKVTFYNDRMVANGECWHCRSRVHQVVRLSAAQARAIHSDEQFRLNMRELMADQIQENHQCGLLHEGKDHLEDLYAELDRAH